MFESDNKLNDDVMLNKLYNMIKTSLSLNNIDNKNELLLNFEKVVKDIDKRDHNLYLTEIEDKFYKTTNLDDERKRLSSLIVLITERIEQRNKLINDYLEVTGQQLNDLDEIIYAHELNDFKARSSIICSYLENEEEIINIKKELEILSNQLEKEREVKRNCEVVNAKLEEKLLNNFKNVIAGNKYYTSLSSKDIEDEIKENERELKEKEEKVNAFVLAYESIKNESITSTEQLEEYSLYVSQMKEMYYECTKKNAFLQIYKLVMNPKISTEEIYHKRILIKKILDDLTAIKLKLKIEEPNLLFDFYILVKEQDVKVINSVDNMKKIKQIEDKIDYFNDKITRLEKLQDNEKIKIILKEYGLITDESYDDLSNEINNNDNIFNNIEFDENDISNNVIYNKNNVIYKENALKLIKTLPNTMNIGLAKKKANVVINKVSSRLGIQKKENINQTQIHTESNDYLKNNNFNSEAINNQTLTLDKENNSLYNEDKISEEEKPIVMPDFDFTKFWDEIVIDNNDNNGNNMPNLPV